MLQTDPENIADVPQIACYQIETAVGIVPPADRDLLDPAAHASRNRQNLDIEHIAVNLRSLENSLGYVVLEKLEAALRILDAAEPHH